MKWELEKGMRGNRQLLVSSTPSAFLCLFLFVVRKGKKHYVASLTHHRWSFSRVQKGGEGPGYAGDVICFPSTRPLPRKVTPMRLQNCVAQILTKNGLTVSIVPSALLPMRNAQRMLF